ncbi:SNU66/SART1 family protein [Kipferlia bialata]|uniref:SNU66/SART1 family protein n=1 Tax=Kipferlia bialata TaxID=797122 RepID=A0A9K3CXZ6_9EUKA|nr:SNU66/SART1 family protein [Kipferlia bialata]|eukprot:g5982.t1
MRGLCLVLLALALATVHANNLESPKVARTALRDARFDRGVSSDQLVKTMMTEETDRVACDAVCETTKNTCLADSDALFESVCTSCDLLSSQVFHILDVQNCGWIRQHDWDRVLLAMHNEEPDPVDPRHDPKMSLRDVVRASSAWSLEQVLSLRHFVSHVSSLEKDIEQQWGAAVTRFRSVILQLATRDCLAYAVPLVQDASVRRWIESRTSASLAHDHFLVSVGGPELAVAYSAQAVDQLWAGRSVPDCDAACADCVPVFDVLAAFDSLAQSLSDAEEALLSAAETELSPADAQCVCTDIVGGLRAGLKEVVTFVGTHSDNDLMLQAWASVLCQSGILPLLTRLTAVLNICHDMCSACTTLETQTQTQTQGEGETASLLRSLSLVRERTLSTLCYLLQFNHTDPSLIECVRVWLGEGGAVADYQVHDLLSHVLSIPDQGERERSVALLLREDAKRMALRPVGEDEAEGVCLDPSLTYEQCPPSDSCLRLYTDPEATAPSKVVVYGDMDLSASALYAARPGRSAYLSPRCLSVLLGGLDLNSRPSVGPEAGPAAERLGTGVSCEPSSLIRAMLLRLVAQSFVHVTGVAPDTVLKKAESRLNQRQKERESMLQEGSDPQPRQGRLSLTMGAAEGHACACPSPKPLRPSSMNRTHSGARDLSRTQMSSVVAMGALPYESQISSPDDQEREDTPNQPHQLDSGLALSHNTFCDMQGDILRTLLRVIRLEEEEMRRHAMYAKAVQAKTREMVSGVSAADVPMGEDDEEEVALGQGPAPQLEEGIVLDSVSEFISRLGDKKGAMRKSASKMVVNMATAHAPEEDVQSVTVQATKHQSFEEGGEVPSGPALKRRPRRQMGITAEKDDAASEAANAAFAAENIGKASTHAEPEVMEAVSSADSGNASISVFDALRMFNKSGDMDALRDEASLALYTDPNQQTEEDKAKREEATAKRQASEARVRMPGGRGVSKGSRGKEMGRELEAAVKLTPFSLEYRDSFGQLRSTKEEYKHMSRVFHNQHGGPKRQEVAMKRHIMTMEQKRRSGTSDSIRHTAQSEAKARSKLGGSGACLTVE